jgi:inorganic phosphate transporter, PiT family
MVAALQCTFRASLIVIPDRRFGPEIAGLSPEALSARAQSHSAHLRGRMSSEPLFCTAVGVTLCFAFVNGFHDGGNVIATMICSRSMRPMRALVLAALAEFIGPLVLGTAVAHTMAGSILKPELLEQLSPARMYVMIICGVGGAIIWKLPTWFFGLPSSGSHALIGGLVGAGVLAMGQGAIEVEKVIRGVVLPLLVTPLLGLMLGFMVFAAIRSVFERAHRGIGAFFTALQKPTMIFLAASHGSNDAQKSMGVIAIIMAAGSGEMHGQLPLPGWAMLACAGALALGLTVGGWRIVKSVGAGICRMEPVHSFASQFASASVILVASLIGGPVSTTQVVASSVMGVGASRRLSSVRWSAAGNIAYAWLLTVPVSAGLGAAAFWLLTRIIPVG